MSGEPAASPPNDFHMLALSRMRRLSRVIETPMTMDDYGPFVSELTLLAEYVVKDRLVEAGVPEGAVRRRGMGEALPPRTSVGSCWATRKPMSPELVIVLQPQVGHEPVSRDVPGPADLGAFEDVVPEQPVDRLGRFPERFRDDPRPDGNSVPAKPWVDDVGPSPCLPLCWHGSDDPTFHGPA